MSQDSGERRTVPDDDIEDADPVLARERTDLAWTRSAISFLALGIAILKIRPLVGIPLLMFSAVVWLIGRGSPAGYQPGAAARRMLLVTVAVCVLALISLVLAFVGRSPGLRS
jgi:hydrogenase-4 membrane subunit HyfE